VVDFLASQLGIADASCVKRYTERPKTAYEHAREMAREFGYRRFSDADAQAEPQAFLAARAWTRAEQPSVLFDAATAHLLERKVLLPAAGTLAELVAGVRETAAHRRWTLLEGLTTPEQAAALGRLLEVEPDARVSRLELLRRAPTGVSARRLRPERA
jgi:Domain of unknown function (DUF4158)